MFILLQDIPYSFSKILHYLMVSLFLCQVNTVWLFGGSFTNIQSANSWGFWKDITKHVGCSKDKPDETGQGTRTMWMTDRKFLNNKVMHFIQPSLESLRSSPMLFPSSNWNQPNAQHMIEVSLNQRKFIITIWKVWSPTWSNNASQEPYPIAHMMTKEN